MPERPHQPGNKATRSGARPGALRDARQVREMFGRIVRRYDTMNRLMTGGRDVAWRRLAARIAVGGAPNAAPVLDLATGTGDLALALNAAGAKRVVGLDAAAPMVRAAAVKTRGQRDVALVVGDALSLPFADGQFAACTVSFGLRNMADYEAALREMSRVLGPGGRLVCLELTPFRRPVLGRLFAWYFSNIVPTIGGLLSGDKEAYRYLPSSVAAFPSADALAELMRRAGLADVSYRLLGAGTVALHVGVKAAPRV
ncbi:MAG: demethylmenaquinone methyltransferase / 2-methoxy-6-polyprenyl,4-benzoquinol methylase [Thermomicrobiales bacterium]|nr:demethylmenaquinone methyltransferase / 2-methoxy-6-polyprenyl,4-benzoquinol methylase [Thermomicrobiales bacterium]